MSGERPASAAAKAAPCRVRPARAEDLPRIWELLLGLAAYERLEHEVSGSAERLGEDLFGPEPRVGCIVAECGSRLIGYALFFPTYSSFRTEPTLWLEDLFVEPSERGRGAEGLIVALDRRLAEDGEDPDENHE